MAFLSAVTDLADRKLNAGHASLSHVVKIYDEIRSRIEGRTKRQEIGTAGKHIDLARVDLTPRLRFQQERAHWSPNLEERNRCAGGTYVNCNRSAAWNAVECPGEDVFILA